jgi:hypothetical protein
LRKTNFTISPQLLNHLDQLFKLGFRLLELVFVSSDRLAVVVLDIVVLEVSLEQFEIFFDVLNA